MENKAFKPALYYTLTLLMTYGCWPAAARAYANASAPALYVALMVGGLVAPFVISLGMIFTSRDSVLRREYRGRLFDIKRIKLSTFPSLLLLMPMVVLASTLLSLLLGESVTQFRLAGDLRFSSRLIPAFPGLVTAAVFQELGWRGYAFDSLESRYGGLWAAVGSSVLWSLWYLPLLLITGTYQYRLLQLSPWFALNFHLKIIPLGIIISWFWIQNRRSVLSAILFHLVACVAQELMAINQVTRIIETSVLTLVAAGIVAADHRNWSEPWCNRSKRARV